MFGVRYIGMDELITRSNISPIDYKSLYPLFVFDVSKQREQEGQHPLTGQCAPPISGGT